MCGICGFNYEDKDTIRRMCDLIYHRGPDDWGFYTDTNISLGVRRLSVIDLKTGHQPQHNENEDIWIVFNGEIYNFLQLRELLEKKGHTFYTNSDTEVIIHAYEEWNENCLKKLRGQFAFCIYDSNKEILFLARDHFGLKPLYYFFYGNKFIFGSEIKTILCHDIKRDLNKETFNLYLSLRYSPFTNTLFKDIYKVSPSSYLIFDLKDKSLRIKQFSQIKFSIESIKSENLLAKELKSLIEESIKIRLISEVPIGVFLSGGIDSSTIVAIMSKLNHKPIKSFSIGFEKGAPVDERKYSKFIAEYYNTDHKELIVKSTCYEILPKLIWHLDDLISDPAIIPVFFMSSLAKKDITVALTGDGADEIFAGYAEQYWLNKKNYFSFIPKNFINHLMRLYRYIPSSRIQMALSFLNSSATDEDRFFRHIINIQDIEKRNIITYEFEKVRSILKNTFNNKLDLINQYINFDLKYQLPNLYNIKTDRMSMAASLEARVPFLDQKIVNWSLKIPSKLKIKNNIEKFILRLAMKDDLPNQILKRKKMGFGTPVNLWLRTGMNEISEEILDNLKKRRNLINSDYIEKLKRKRTSNIFEYQIWILLNFELWYETFIENEGLNYIKI